MNDSFVSSVRTRPAVQASDAPDLTADPTAARQGSGRPDEPAMAPRVDVVEDDSGITLFADLPGVSKESLDIKVENDALLIEASVSAALPQAMQAAYAEVRVARYRRAFALSRELDAAHVEAQLTDGVLKLRIPKHEQARPQRIAVKVS